MFSFPDKQWSEIKKEFGIHCVRHGDLRKAKNFFEKSLAFDKEKLDSVYLLANTLAKEAILDESLNLLNEISVSQQEKFQNHFKCNIQQSESHYENNDFEKSLLLLIQESQKLEREVTSIPKVTHDMIQKQADAKLKGPKIGVLCQRTEMIQINFDDMIGKNAGNCLFELRKYFGKIIDERHQNKDEKVDKSKILIKLNECDVVSLMKENEQEITIKDVHRLEHLKRIFSQSYMKSAWKDFEFINGLKKNKILSNSTQNTKSFQKINKEIDECTKQISKFISQLHARCPLYTYRRQMFSSQMKREEANRILKFRMQYKTRREMFTALEQMHQMRTDGKLNKLIEIAEHELGFHFQIKSEVLMPRKREFTTEICNLIGLAYLDKLKIPNHFESKDLKFLAKVFEVSSNQGRKKTVSYIFGNQSTYRDPAEPDTSFLVFKKNIHKLENRLKSSTMPIERCYLYHEMGKLNLKQNKLIETRNFGKKIIDESEMIGNFLWAFLGQILLVRADVMQKNVFKINGALTKAYEMVKVLQNKTLETLLEDCLQISQIIQENHEGQ